MSFLKSYPFWQIIQQLAHQKKIKVYLVGGFLRDFLLGRGGAFVDPAKNTRDQQKRPHPIDFDFAVSLDAIAFARQFAQNIKGAFVLLDQNEGCARVVKKTRGQILVFDFAEFRALTLKGDLSHRDFTINTLCVDLDDLSESTSFDPLIQDLKGGKQDIKAKRIRMTSSKIFKEDPLRLLRAFSLKATLDFKIEVKTLNQIKKDKELLRNVSIERIREELFKIFASSQCAETLKTMDQIGLLPEVLPQIRVMYGVKQGGYHHLDVWPHSLLTVAEVEKVLQEFCLNPEIKEYLNQPLSGVHTRADIVKFAALLHDIGKPDTQRQEKDRMSFHGHEHVGKNIVRSMAKMLKLSVVERHMLEDMVQWHLRPGYLSNFKQPSERMIFRYFRDTKDEAVSILLLSLADQRSTRGPLTSEDDQRHHESIVRVLVKQYFEKKRQKPLVRLIDGNNLIRLLKLKPSPIFAKILRAVEEQQALQKIQTKQEALSFAKEMIEKEKGKQDAD